jgi:phage shock protein C
MTSEVKRLYRSKKEKMIGGVCGGLGEFFQVDPIIFRLIFLMLLFGVGSGALIYIVMMLIIPEAPTEVKSVEETEE